MQEGSGGPAGIILAAGLGTRMKSRLSKALHPLGGRPMVSHVAETAREAGLDPIVVVVGHQADEVRQLLGPALVFVHQEQQLGTGHAVACARPALDGRAEDAVVLYADCPLLRARTLQRLVAAHRRSGAAATVLTARVVDPAGYGRIVREDGRLVAVVEEADAPPEQRRIKEVNSGVYCFALSDLFGHLPTLTAENVKGEYYLTEIIGTLVAAGAPVETLMVDDPEEILGVGDRRALAGAEEILRRREVDRLLEAGVTVVQPGRVYVERGVRVGQDTVLHPDTYLRGSTAVGEDCVIGPGADLTDAEVGPGCRVSYSVLVQARLGRRCQVGPFAHLRPGTELADGARVGNFAEVKNSHLGPGTKVPHHSYVGDATLGEGCNVGAGAVFVNYDGRRKHRTEAGDFCFIGCNSNLVAPLTLGSHSYVAAGSTVTRDVPSDALAVARGRQRVVEGWVGRRRRDEV